MSSLDFSNFKKTGQDKKSATLIHPDGHEIKIAIGGLSPDLKKKLEALPLHQAEGSEEPVEALDDESPAEASDAPEVEQGAEEEVAATPAPAETPAQVAPAQAAPAPVAQPMAAPVAAAPKPVAQVSTPDQVAAKKTQDDINFAQDMNSGHIKAKTYSDLYHEKSTLGKMGTLFGLVLSGIGSGGLGQSNALLGMMDKQIANDLEAQKADQSNKQNWYKLSVEKSRNDVMNDLTNSEIGKNMTINDREQFVNGNMGVVKSIGSLTAENKMILSTIETQQGIVNRLPPGPRRDQAQAELNNNVIPTAFKKLQENNVKAANLEHGLMSDASKFKTFGQQAFNPPPNKGFADPNKYYSAVNQPKLNDLVQKGKLDPRIGIPPGQVPTVLDEQKQLESHRDTFANAQKAFRILDEIKNSGQIPASGALSGIGSLIGSVAGSAGGPLGTAAGGAAGKFLGDGASHGAKEYYERLRNVVMDSLVGQLDRNKSAEERRRIAESMMPSWADDSKSRQLAHKELQQQFASDPREKATNLELYGLKTPMPKYDYNSGRVNTTSQDISDASNRFGEGVAGLKKAASQAVAGTGKDKKDSGWLGSVGKMIGLD